MVHAFDRSGLSGAIRQLADARAAGVRSAWLTQVYGLEALTVLAVAGREIPDLLLGTAVVPTYARHPMVMASQALTTQAAVGGRLRLGIGPSHQAAVEGMMGIPYDRPVRHTREYLTVLGALLLEGSVDYSGETLSAATLMGPLEVSDAAPFPVLVAALGPAMLAVTGELADGTITWLAGPGVVGERIAPQVRAAAAAAGRPDPQVVVGLPVCVTADPGAARERVARRLGPYSAFPSYRRLLDEEGAAGPADVAIVGDEDHVARQIAALAGCGATEFMGQAVGSVEERAATVRLLGQLTGG